MTIQHEITPIAEILAAKQWKWNQLSIDSILASMGWQKLNSLPYRDDYSCFKKFRASVYKEDYCPERIEIDVKVYRDVDSLDERQFADKIDEFKTRFLEATETIVRSLGKPIFFCQFCSKWLS